MAILLIGGFETSVYEMEKGCSPVKALDFGSEAGKQSTGFRTHPTLQDWLPRLRLKGRRFDTVAEIQRGSQIPHSSSQHQDLQHRLCVQQHESITSRPPSVGLSGEGLSGIKKRGDVIKAKQEP
ncbi:hypothetical protein C0J50_14268 [Silurus asotus]|uniref:Uncharacterized protein n=1 Tax=Silurus asotus TaxID=30991 RepID=A0AAD5FS18_SILAS|nr:hypothetical protein C0J50_14268 [Silurus asotus]